MNTITALHDGLDENEQAALADTAARLASKWDKAKADDRSAIELEFTEALNVLRSGPPLTD